MSEDKHPGVMAIEAHENFVQHIEETGAKVRTLSLITIVVAALLVIGYLSQLLILPFLLGVTTQTVNLLDPDLVVLELLLLVLALAWLYVGVRDYTFVRMLLKQVREIRALEEQMEKRITN